MKKNKKVTIIGSGVSGLTTALILNARNWDVTIISKDDPRDAPMDPEFASLYPAASVIPHSVYSDDLVELFRVSQDYFQSLYEDRFPGVKLYEHFELFAYNQPLPEYAQLLKNLRTWNEFKNEFHPKHPEYAIRSGWKYNGFFADWSIYFPELIDQVLNKGVHFIKRTLEPEDLSSMPFDHIINCSELGSVKLFGDEHDLIYRGHILHVKDAPKLFNPQNRPVSYNFSPDLSVYKSTFGITQDVYYYPRKDGWILGGSRQEGHIDENGKWKGEEVQEPLMVIDGVKVPAQIMDLHSQIIDHSFDVDIKKLNQPAVKVGYRYVRKKENGLRLEAEELEDKMIIHNYGHGGAGVTLSWGCALKVAKMLESEV